MNTNRDIPRFFKTSQKNIIVYGLIIGVIIIALILTGMFVTGRLNATPEFIPPGFDAAAQIGEPSPPLDFGYTTVNVEQGFDIKLCGRLFARNNTIDIYLTNPASNNVWIMTEVQDENGKVLAKSGIIKPGEYVQSVALANNVTAVETNVKIVVIGYAPDSYASRGMVGMKTTLFKQ
ncbi:hypothetical protein [Acetobacterium sp.]|uniref:hypothetical protein n=1 Tax=Acetobacterium sp. TaxID=1872094 RepID=UPI002F3F1AE2